MKIEVVEPNEKVSIEEINQIENRFDFKFPDDYKKFLLEFNGGEPTNGLAFLNDYSIGPLHIYDFFSLSDAQEQLEYIEEDTKSYKEFIQSIKDDNQDFEKLIESFKDEIEEYKSELKHYIFAENNMLTIADTFNNVLLCICYKGENLGKIYWIDAIHNDQFHLLADSFDHFINGFSLDESNL